MIVALQYLKRFLDFQKINCLICTILVTQLAVHVFSACEEVSNI